MPKIKINYNSHDLMKNSVHGRHKKDMIVLHETVSPDIAGMADIIANENYLAKIGYGIHGMVDRQGFIALAEGLDTAIFWQAGGVNERSIGIEQVSPIPTLIQRKIISIEEAESLWKSRATQLLRTAILVAGLATKHGIPIKYSTGITPGITAHWNISQHFKESEGHTDCWPIQAHGYYPILFVIYHARKFKSEGWVL